MLVSQSGIFLKAELFPVPLSRVSANGNCKAQPIRGLGELFVTQKRKPMLWSTGGRDDGKGQGNYWPVENIPKCGRALCLVSLKRVKSGMCSHKLLS